MESLLELHGDDKVEPTAPPDTGRLSAVARARHMTRRRVHSDEKSEKKAS